MFYLVFLAIALIEMLWEWRVSYRNSTTLILQGAKTFDGDVLPWMSLAYGLMFLGSAGEYQYFDRTVSVRWAIPFIALYILAKALKLWAVRALGSFWTMRVMIVPGSRVIRGGPYKWIRHPNYVAVIMEMTAIPLAGRNWITFAVTTSAFLVLLALRIQAEEHALMKYTDYSEAMNRRNRFVP